ncbi:MAG: hypothetical protein AAB728_05915, partial [Patescibacteria group bacterium]
EEVPPEEKATVEKDEVEVVEMSSRVAAEEAAEDLTADVEKISELEQVGVEPSEDVRAGIEEGETEEPLTAKKEMADAGSEEAMNDA